MGILIFLVGLAGLFVVTPVILIYWLFRKIEKKSTRIKMRYAIVVALAGTILIMMGVYSLPSNTSNDNATNQRTKTVEEDKDVHNDNAEENIENVATQDERNNGIEKKKEASETVKRIKTEAKKKAKKVSKEELNTAANYINTNLAGCFEDNSAMSKVLSYGYLLYFHYGKDIPAGDLGYNSVKAVRLVYEKGFDPKSKEVQSYVSEASRNIDQIIGANTKEKATNNNSDSDNTAKEDNKMEKSSSRSSDNESALAGFIFVLIVGVVVGGFYLYEYTYFRSDKFKNLKAGIQDNINDCNEYNEYITVLSETDIGVNQLDYGEGIYYDSSSWRYKRPQLRKQAKASNIYQCSRNICDNARRQPFKYICKYFEIKPTEENLSKFELLLHNLQSAYEGIRPLNDERKNIIKSIWKELPFLIRLDKKRICKELKLYDIQLERIEFPSYIFQYVSSGGNASLFFKLDMNFDNLNRFIVYLDKKIQYRKSVVGQRALMTGALRQKIKERDNYTCQKCGNSIWQEPNLLLEIDHIKPVSKGGLTTEDNLQTLCWRCNRKKGAKYLGD